MAIRVFGRVLLSGLALPNGEFNEARFLPSSPAFFAPNSHNPRPILGALASSEAKPLKSKFGRGGTGKPKSASGKQLSTRRPSKKLRRTVLFGIPALVILGSFMVGGLSDSADATSSCTNQQGSNGITDARVVGANCVLTFSTVGTHTWTKPTGVSSLADVIVIAGGGAGGSRHGGGDGAGGFNRSYNISVPNSSYSITIGAGGIGTTNGSAAQTSGGNSSAFGITMTGGGRGGGTNWAAETGGSGGGANFNGAGAAGTVGQGNSGGWGRSAGGWAGGGGGGAASSGSSSPSNYVGGQGGDGVQFTIRGITDYAAAGGGGAGEWGGGAAGANAAGGGVGGGGSNGGSNGVSWGSGGGGGSFNDYAGVWGYKGGDGRSGAVLVSYVIPTAPAAPTLSSITAGNASLSVAFSAPSSDVNTAPTNYEYSTDGGSTWKSRASGSTASPLLISTVSSSSANLVDGTSYNVRIRAVNVIGASTQSNQVSASSGIYELQSATDLTFAVTGRALTTQPSI